MRIDVLFIDGCPHHQETARLVCEVARDLGVRADVREVRVGPEDQGGVRFPGSPTVLVDGSDIDPGRPGESSFSMSCRLYGTSGVPPREMIDAALRTRILPSRQVSTGAMRSGRELRHARPE